MRGDQPEEVLRALAACDPGRIPLTLLGMVALGGIVGGLVGFGIALVITEVIIGNPPDQTGFDWALWTDVALAIVGVLAGISVARRLAGRRRSRAA